MRILSCLTYYRPHYSGMTVYAERLAQALAARGHAVTILTSRYDRRLPALERSGGLAVRRVAVAFRVSKGVIMPSFLVWGARLAAASDVVHLHVPQLDAAPLALVAWALGKPVVLTYQSELLLPASPVNWLASRMSQWANLVSANVAQVVTSMTRDFAEASPFLSRYLDKLEVIPPPVVLPPAEPGVTARLRRRLDLQPGDRLIGMVARLATEKGAEVLAHALPAVLQRFPRARVLYVGQYRDVFGEQAYARRLEPMLQRMQGYWSFLGVLPAEEMTAFYGLCDLTVLPSLNSTESFGMVQVESMVCGTPVVASDLPGVRQPTAMTGMGLTVPPGDSSALAQAILQVLESPERFRGDPAAVAERFSPSRVAEQYERLFRRLLGGPGQGKSG